MCESSIKLKNLRLLHGQVFVMSGLPKCFPKKVQVGKDQENAQSEKDSRSKNQGGKKKLTIRYLYHENIS